MKVRTVGETKLRPGSYVPPMRAVRPGKRITLFVRGRIFKSFVKVQVGNKLVWRGDAALDYIEDDDAISESQKAVLQDIADNGFAVEIMSDGSLYGVADVRVK